VYSNLPEFEEIATAAESEIAYQKVNERVYSTK